MMKGKGINMLELSMMYVVIKCIALATSLVTMLDAGDKIEQIVLLSLVLSCVIAIQFIVSLKEKYLLSAAFINWFGCIVCLAMNPKSLMPILLLLFAESIDFFTQDRQYYMVLGCMISLLFLIFSPNYFIITVCAIIIAFTCYVRYLILKVTDYRKSFFSYKEELCQLEEKIKDNNRLIKTLRYTSALEERNRLAAKLHDKIGHGISGSIIMLEASMMMLDKDRERAKEGIEKSIANLRVGVDDIRTALKEERPIKSELGLNEIKMKLEQFKVNYGVITSLLEQGNMQGVNLTLWQCIHDNLEEALTNLLKHSNATSFTLKLVAMNKLLSVEYRDNGTEYVEEKSLTMGLGLEAMEERTIKCGGKFFVEQSRMGFVIKNIFICE